MRLAGAVFSPTTQPRTQLPPWYDRTMPFMSGLTADGYLNTRYSGNQNQEQDSHPRIPRQMMYQSHEHRGLQWADKQIVAQRFTATIHFHGTASAAAYLPCLHLAFQGCAALIGSDVVHQSLDIGDGSNRQQIYAENDAPSGHVLGSDLTPPTRGGTKVDAHLRRAKEVILLVDLERHTQQTRKSHVSW